MNENFSKNYFRYPLKFKYFGLAGVLFLILVFAFFNLQKKPKQNDYSIDLKQKATGLCQPLYKVETGPELTASMSYASKCMKKITAMIV